MRSIASYPAGPHGRIAQKTVIGPPLLGAGGEDTICTEFAIPLLTSTARRLCLFKSVFHCFKHLFHFNNKRSSNG